MPLYKVVYKSLITYTGYVEAESELQAREIVNDELYIEDAVESESEFQEVIEVSEEKQEHAVPDQE